MISGRLSFTTPTRVEGKLKGELRCTELCIIGPTAVIEGTVRAEELRVEGCRQRRPRLHGEAHDGEARLVVRERHLHAIAQVHGTAKRALVGDDPRARPLPGARDHPVDPVLLHEEGEPREAREELRGALRTLGYDLGDIRRFLITHMHRDHYTLAVRLRREFGGPIALGGGQGEALEIILHPAGNREPGELQHWGAVDAMSPDRLGFDPADSQAIYEMPDDWITGRRELALAGRTLQAIPIETFIQSLKAESD